MADLDLHPRYIRYLVEVVDQGSFSRAAERLGVSQPAISRRIKMLEDALGFKLLERLARTAILTDQGRAILPAFRSLLDWASKTALLVDELKAKRVKPTRVGVAIYCRQPERSELLADFLVAHPNSVMDVESGHIKALVGGLWEGKFDVLGIVSTIPDARFEYIALRWLPVRIIVPKSSPLASLASVPVSALKGITIATFERNLQEQLFDQLFLPLRTAGANLVFPDHQATLGILTYAAKHNSVAIMAFEEFDADDMERLHMVERPLRDIQPIVALMLMRLAGESRSRSTRLWEFARQWAASRGVPQR